MDISLVYNYLVKEAENIKNIAIYLTILWGVLFTKDWLSITSFYSFYRISSLCKVEFKQILNLRYVATLIISILHFIVFNLLIRKNTFYILVIGAIGSVFCLVVIIVTNIKANAFELSKSPGAADGYRVIRECNRFYIRMLVGTLIVFSLIFVYSPAVNNVLNWESYSEPLYTLIFFFPLVVFCLLTDSVLIRLASSSSQSNYFFYYFISTFRQIKFPNSNFYRINKVVTTIYENNSTYALVFPLDNEERKTAIAIRADICRKNNYMTFIYVYTDDIIYDLDLSKYKQKTIFVDKATRMNVDTTISNSFLNSNEQNRTKLVRIQFWDDDMKVCWNNETWEEIDYSIINTYTKKQKRKRSRSR